MLRRSSYIIIFLTVFLNIVLPGFAQIRKNAFTIENEQMVLYIDLKASKNDIDSLLKTADIKGVAANSLVKGDFNQLQRMGWTVRRSKKDELMLLKPLEDLGRNPQMQAAMIIENQGGPIGKRSGYPGAVPYGVNSFTKRTVHELPSGYTRFFIPGNLNAKKVLLSGDFNDWSTSKGIMSRTDSGWIADVKLHSGAHMYKFIVNGHWMSDGNNRLRDDDDNGNSIYYRYNYTFKLSGFANAKRVMVAGGFNKWNGNEIVMSQKTNGWYASLYLGEGQQTYNFLIDAKWITDPANPNRGVDANGRPASIINLGTNVLFKLTGFTDARDVVLAGDFNNWKPDQIHLKKSGNSWQLLTILPQGNYGYKFIVDGRWMRDPANQHTVDYNGETNSFISVNPNHTFVLKGNNNAHTIRLSGSFNGWSESGYTLSHDGAEWKIALNLKPGKYLYKYLVDGNWIIDPGNKLWEQNEFNTGNSVLWIDP